MNPFDWRGPQFLAFYALLVVVAVFLTRRIRIAMDGDDANVPSTASVVSDPYLIAYLRAGGPLETLQIALMSLMDRGLIVYDGLTFKTADGVLPEHGRRNIERAILQLYARGGTLEALSSLAGVGEEYEQQLQRMRLMPDEALKARRRTLRNLMWLVVCGIGVIKIVIGIQRDRPVGFLVLLTVIAFLWLHAASWDLRTRHGDEFLVDLRRLFAGLRERAGSIARGGATADLALLAAAFGLAAVPLSVFPYPRLFAPRQTGSSSSGTSTSSCGSSCSSSCGGGCGGGGCGGCGGD